MLARVSTRATAARFVLAALLLAFACQCEQAAENRRDGAGSASANSVASVPENSEEIFARLGGSFIASERLPSGAVLFYAQPKPYSSWLCRIDVIQTPPWIVEGRAKTEGEFWDDDVTVTRMYAAWRSPREDQDKDRMQACREFRNFDGMFATDDDLGSERFVYLLDRLQHDLETGEVRYPIECVDKRSDRDRACDPQQALQGVSIYSRFSGTTTAERESETSTVRTDSLTFPIGQDDGHPVALDILFESEQHYGRQSVSEADIRSVKISVEVL